MKINIRSEAQDGRFTIDLAGKDIEMRVSIIPAEFGETIVMRFLILRRRRRPCRVWGCARTILWS